MNIFRHIDRTIMDSVKRTTHSNYINNRNGIKKKSKIRRRYKICNLCEYHDNGYCSKRKPLPHDNIIFNCNHHYIDYSKFVSDSISKFSEMLILGEII